MKNLILPMISCVQNRVGQVSRLSLSLNKQFWPSVKKQATPQSIRTSIQRSAQARPASFLGGSIHSPATGDRRRRVAVPGRSNVQTTTRLQFVRSRLA
jgi:hypothetical protein